MMGRDRSPGSTVPERRPAWRLLLSPAGAALAGICFFLPWGRFSCLGMHRQASGADVGGWFWALFASALVAFAASMAAWRLPSKVLPGAVTMAAALAGLLVLIWRAVEGSRGMYTPFGRLHPERSVALAFGVVGTVAGLLVALAGGAMLLLWRREGRSAGAPDMRGARRNRSRTGATAEDRIEPPGAGS